MCPNRILITGPGQIIPAGVTSSDLISPECPGRSQTWPGAITAQWGYRASIHFFSLYCLFVSPQRLLGLFQQVPDHLEHDPYHFHHPQSPYSCLRRRRSVAAWFHKPILLKPYPIQIVPSSNCTLLKLYPPPFASNPRLNTCQICNMPLSWYSKVVFDLVSLFGGAVLY